VGLKPNETAHPFFEESSARRSRAVRIRTSRCNAQRALYQGAVFSRAEPRRPYRKIKHAAKPRSDLSSRAT